VAWVGYFASVTTNKSLEESVIIGIIFGALAGLFVPGLGSVIASIIGNRLATELQDWLGDLPTDRVKNVASALGRLSSGVAAYTNKKFGHLIENVVAGFAVLGIFTRRIHTACGL